MGRGTVLLLLLPLFGAAADGAENLSVRGIMRQLNVLHGRAGAALEKDTVGEDVYSDLNDMDRLYAELAGLHTAQWGGDPARWAEACRQSREAIERVRGFLDENRLPEAREAYRSLARWRETAHEEFRPGIWRRIFGPRDNKPQPSDDGTRDE